MYPPAAFGAFSPYVGWRQPVDGGRAVGVDLDPAYATGSLAYAGVSYNWRGYLLTAEVEKGTLVSYGFRIGKRF
jgi:hypothetical protein